MTIDEEVVPVHPWSGVSDFLLNALENIVSRLLKVMLAVVALPLPTLGWAQGKIAVVNLQEAILQTDEAQKRLTEVRDQ